MIIIFHFSQNVKNIKILIFKKKNLVNHLVFLLKFMIYIYFLSLEKYIINRETIMSTMCVYNDAYKGITDLLIARYQELFGEFK